MPPRPELSPVVRTVYSKKVEDEYIGTATYTRDHPQAGEEHTWKSLEQVCIKFTLESARLAQSVFDSDRQRAIAFQKLRHAMSSEFFSCYISMAVGTTLRIPILKFHVSDKKTKDGQGMFVEFKTTLHFTLDHKGFDPNRNIYAMYLANCTKLDYVCRFGKDGKPFAFVGNKEEQAASSMSFNQAQEDELSFENFSFTYFSNERTHLQSPEGSVASTNFGG